MCKDLCIIINAIIMQSYIQNNFFNTFNAIIYTKTNLNNIFNAKFHKYNIRFCSI